MLGEQTKLSLLGTRKSTRAPSASSPQGKIDCLVWDRNFWSYWSLLLWRQRRCSVYCEIRKLCGNATQHLWTRITSTWNRSLISMVSARWSNRPHSKGINECSAEKSFHYKSFPVAAMFHDRHVCLISPPVITVYGCISKAEFSSLSLEP